MRLSIMLLAVATAILVNVDVISATDNAVASKIEAPESTYRLRAENGGRNLKKYSKNTGKSDFDGDSNTDGKSKLSTDKSTEEERGGGGLISWMFFQNIKSKKSLEKLESINGGKLARHRIIKPFQIDNLDENAKAALGKVEVQKIAKKRSTS